jgi:hypothetical protein
LPEEIDLLLRSQKLIDGGGSEIESGDAGHKTVFLTQARGAWAATMSHDAADWQ